VAVGHGVLVAWGVGVTVRVATGVVSGDALRSVAVSVAVAPGRGVSVTVAGWHVSKAASATVASAPATNERRVILGREFMVPFYRSAARQVD